MVAVLGVYMYINMGPGLPILLDVGYVRGSFCFRHGRRRGEGFHNRRANGHNIDWLYLVACL